MVQQVRMIREEREHFGIEIERKERDIREQRARKKREREASQLEEASGWPQQQEAITGPWCVCSSEGLEVGLVSSTEDLRKHFDLPLVIFIIGLTCWIVNVHHVNSLQYNSVGGRMLNYFVLLISSCLTPTPKLKARLPISNRTRIEFSAASN